MSQSHALHLHILQMEEIRTILNAMKNLALIEVHKLGRLQPLQSQVVNNMALVAQDFLTFYPNPILEHEIDRHFCIVLGAERGFCGDFNSSLINAIGQQTYTGIIALGSRLCNRLNEDTPTMLKTLMGANVSEEIPTILNSLIDTLNSLSKDAEAQSSFKLTVIYHESHTSSIIIRQLLPPFATLSKDKPLSQIAPVLNSAPADFFRELLHHYLFAALNEILYLSLLAENNRRLQHLEGAVKHLDDETQQLQQKSQIYRQEEITEEIEVILLNAENI